MLMEELETLIHFGSLDFMLWIVFFYKITPTISPQDTNLWQVDAWIAWIRRPRRENFCILGTIISQLEPNFRHVKIMPSFASCILKSCF